MGEVVDSILLPTLGLGVTAVSATKSTRGESFNKSSTDLGTGVATSKSVLVVLSGLRGVRGVKATSCDVRAVHVLYCDARGV